jgi:hypothetical protein
MVVRALISADKQATDFRKTKTEFANQLMAEG